MTSKQTVIKFKNKSWIDIDNVDFDIISDLQKKYKFHDLDCEDILSTSQRSKIDIYDKYMFIVLHFPVDDKKIRTLRSTELYIFVSKHYLITIHKSENKLISSLREQCGKNLKTKKEFMGEGMGYLLYEVVLNVFQGCFPLLYNIEKFLNHIESDVFDHGSQQRDMLKDILLAKKNINVFRRIISPQRFVISTLENKTSKFFGTDIEAYFDDVVDMLEKIWGNLEELKEIAGFLQETNESVLTHSTNNIIKILTSFSVVMLPLTLVTGYYGMNVILPFSEYPFAFLGILVGMFVIVISMLFLFKFKKWL